MRASLATSTDKSIFTDVPFGYPTGRHPVDGCWEIPVLAKVPPEKVPDQLVAFNDLGRVDYASNAAVHFFKNDASFNQILRDPAVYTTKFSPYRAILTPDITIGSGMNLWMKAQRVAYSRMVGVVWQTRGLTVIPTVRWTVRWIEENDLDLSCAGIPTNSVIAVSNYGSRRDLFLRAAFEGGLPQVIERLRPAGTLVFGDLRGRVFDRLSHLTTFRQYLPPTADFDRAQWNISAPNESTLFSAS